MDQRPDGNAVLDFHRPSLVNIPVSERQPEKVSGGSGGTPILVLIDDRQFTLDCLGEWLKINTPDYQTLPIRSVETIMSWSDIQIKKVAVILLRVGDGLIGDPKFLSDLDFLKSILPDTPVILLAESDNLDDVVDALGHGIRGYLPASTDLKVLAGAIRLILSGGIFVPASALAQSLQIRRSSYVDAGTPAFDAGMGFTPRQIEVLSCLRRGMPNKVIAHELQMCESTVKVHVRHIMKKLHATNRTQVVLMTNTLFAEDGERLNGGKQARRIV